MDPILLTFQQVQQALSKSLKYPSFFCASVEFGQEEIFQVDFSSYRVDFLELHKTEHLNKTNSHL